MKRTLILDVDGVILDHARGMIAWAEKKGIPVGCTPEGLYCYSMSPMFPHMSDKEIWQALEDYSNDDDFAHIPEIDGFADALDGLRQRIPDLKVLSITAPGASAKTTASRIENVRRFNFDKIVVLPLGSSKLEHLAAIEPGAVFFDDVLHHVQAAESVGHRGVLFRQPHNAGTTHHRVLESWKGAEDFVYELLVGTKPQNEISFI